MRIAAHYLKQNACILLAGNFVAIKSRIPQENNVYRFKRAQPLVERFFNVG